jgi:hypothetical protein
MMMMMMMMNLYSILLGIIVFDVFRFAEVSLYAENSGLLGRYF